MSWTAHDFGPYAIQGRLGGRVALLPLYIGSLGPDLFTKWYVYGVDFLGIDLGAADAPAFHRSWPGAGFTHAPFFALLVALAVYAVFRNRIWAVSLGLGLFLHCLTDSLDTFGTMLLFPFTTEQFPVGLWAYSVGQGSRYDDGTAYFSSPGLIVDLAFLTLALVNFRVLKRAYFESKVLPVDPVMRWAGRHLSMASVLAIYRFGFFFGVTRLAACLIFVHVIHSNPLDISWGGPSWVEPVR